MTHARSYAALAIASIALVLAIRTSLHGSPDVASTAGSACVDQQARERIDQLGRSLAARDVTIAELARVSAGAGVTTGSSAPPSSPIRRDEGIRRFTHIETSNPAVTVTQKDDGTYDIHTTDPSLAGTIITVTAVTATGDEDKMMIRIPQ